MSKKTIVMVGNMSWGMYKFRADLMREFVNLGHRVVVVSPRDEWSKDIETLGCEYIELMVDRKGINPLKDLLYIFKLTKILLTLRADIVLCYTIKQVLYGSIASWLTGVPQRIAITTGLGYAFSAGNWISILTKCLYKVALVFSSQVWFLNQDDRTSFISGKLVNPRKTFVLPGEGVDVDYYKPMPKTDEVITFALISRMLWDKGVGLFVECAEEIKITHPHIKFLLVGPIDSGNPEGISIDIINEWTKTGSLSYLGHLNDIRGILKETSCLVHPPFYREGLPRILLEANSMGIPCITTDIPGCREVIIHQENGFIVPPKNKELLKEAMINFTILDKKEKDSITLLARKRVIENFSSTTVLEIYVSKLDL